MGLKILNTGSYSPENIVSNFDLEKIMDTSDEWIRQRTGIEKRRFSKTEDTSDLALEAAKKALEGFDKTLIRMVLVASFTPDLMMPNMASFIHKNLGLAEDCFALDINLACSGFTAGLKLAEGYLEEGGRALVIGSEVISKHLNMEDRSTAVVFGDGAGAFLVEKNMEPMIYNHGVVEDNDDLTMVSTTLDARPTYLTMKGRDVYKFAVRYVPKTIKNTLKKANLDPTDIDFFILHQANARILSQVAKNLKIDEEKFPMNMASYANTSAATIPILVDEMNKANKLKQGDKLLFSSFGAGLQYSSLILEW